MSFLELEFGDLVKNNFNMKETKGALLLIKVFCAVFNVFQNKICNRIQETN